LQTAISELKVNVDENRFEQELIYYLETSPKKSTFDNHLDYFWKPSTERKLMVENLVSSPRKWDVKSIRWVLNPITHKCKISRSDEETNWKKKAGERALDNLRCNFKK
jgi:hypothetical protein